MKPPPPDMLGNLQLHLPLLNVPASLIPPDIQPELVLALVDLLVGTARVLGQPAHEGGDDDRKADH